MKKNIKENVFKEGDFVVSLLMEGPLKIFKVIKVNSFGNLTSVNWREKSNKSEEAIIYFGIKLHYRLATENELRIMEVKEIFNKNK